MAMTLIQPINIQRLTYDEFSKASIINDGKILIGRKKTVQNIAFLPQYRKDLLTGKEKIKKLISWSLIFGILIFICASCNNKNTLEEAVMEEYYMTVSENIYEDATQYKSERMISTEQPRGEHDDVVISSQNTTESTLFKKKIIKDGNIFIQTQDINVAKKGIDNLVKSLNAYYENESLGKSDYDISYDLKIRVPADNFEKLVSSVEQGKDEIKRKNIRARDVTEEYADITARLASKKDYLKQYTVLLARANSIKDILEIKENIRKLQEEIESTEGRLRYLNDQITYSTLIIELYQKIDYVYKPESKDSFIEHVKSSLNTGWTVVVEIFYFLLSIWWVFIILIPVFFFVRRRIKKRKTSKNKIEEPTNH